MRDASFNIWQVQRLFPFSKPFSFWVPEWGIKSNLLRGRLNYSCLICLLLRWLVLWRTDNLRNLLLRILFLNLSWLIFYFLLYTIIILLFPALLIRFRILTITASFKLWLIFGIWIRNSSTTSSALFFFLFFFFFFLVLVVSSWVTSSVAGSSFDFFSSSISSYSLPVSSWCFSIDGSTAWGATFSSYFSSTFSSSTAVFYYSIWVSLTYSVDSAVCVS